MPKFGRCLLMNARSVMNKLTELQSLLDGQYFGCDFDLVGVTEGWLHLSRDDEDPDVIRVLISHDKYVTFTNIRQGKQGGGVLLYVKKHYHPISIQIPPECAEVEIIALDLKINKHNVRLACMYRPPNADAELDASILSCVRHLFGTYDKGSVIFMGDLNLPGIDWTVGTH